MGGRVYSLTKKRHVVIGCEGIIL